MLGKTRIQPSGSCVRTTGAVAACNREDGGAGGGLEGRGGSAGKDGVEGRVCDAYGNSGAG